LAAELQVEQESAQPRQCLVELVAKPAEQALRHVPPCWNSKVEGDEEEQERHAWSSAPSQLPHTSLQAVQVPTLERNSRAPQAATQVPSLALESDGRIHPSRQLRQVVPSVCEQTPQS